MNWDLVVVLGTAVGWLLAVIFLLPWAIGLFVALWPGKDAGPPPPSGHGWIAPNAKKR